MSKSMRRSTRTSAAVVACLALLPVGTAPAGYGEQPGPDDEHASCMGLGSAFYAQFAPGQRASVAHIVKAEIASVPGLYYREFAQEKEGGEIPAPCGTRIE